MWKYVLKRVILAFITLFIILSLTFILIKMLPLERALGGAPARVAYYLKQTTLGFVYNFDKPQEGLKFIEHISLNGVEYYFYEVPYMEQYFKWLGNIVLRWDWGTSRVIERNVDAMIIILGKLKNTVKINIFATLFSVPIGILLGIWAALKKNKLTDHIISTSVMIFISVPGFVLITFLMLILCYNNAILPSQWPSPSAATSTKVLGYILPVFCLSFGSICGYARYVRAELCEVMSSDYLLLARTKGLTRKQAIIRHAMKNAMVPIFPSILAEVIGLLGGSMVLEKLYGIQGIGNLFIEALTGKDYNVLFVDMALFTMISLLAGVVLDLSYGFIDPRIRMGAKK